MAQVRKLQSGGRAKFVINNKETPIDDVFIRQWNEAYKDDPYMLSLINNPEKTISIYQDNINNTFDVVGVDDSTADRRRDRRTQNESRKKALQQLFTNRPGRVVEGGKYLSPGEGMTLEVVDGKVVVDPRVKQTMAALFNPETYNNMTGVSGFKTMKTIEGVKDLFDTDAQKIINEFELNPTKENWEKVKHFYDEINVTASDAPKTQEQLEAEAKAKAEADKQKSRTALTEKGWDGNIYGDRFKVDENGKIVLTDSDLINALSDYNQNLWLNKEFQDFAADQYNYDFSWIPEDGLFRINGNWYLGSDVDSIQGVDRKRLLEWIDANKKNPIKNNNLIVQHWGTVSPYEYSSASDNMYSNHIQEGDYYQDLSGRYKRDKNTPLIYDVLSKDLVGTDIYDKFGYILPEYLKRIYIDNNGNLIENFDERSLQPASIEEMLAYYGDGNKNRKTAFYNYDTGNDGAVTLRPIWGVEGNGTGYKLYQNPKNGMYYWHNQNFMGNNSPLNSEYKDIHNSAIAVNDLIAQYIMDHQNDLQYNPELAYEIDAIARNPYLSGSSLRYSNNKGSQLWNKYNLNALYDALISSGYNLNGINYNYMGNPLSSSFRTDAKNNHYIITLDPRQYKDGGILKFADGGVKYNPNTNATKQNDKKLSAPARAAGANKVIGDGTDLNASDWAALATLVGDTASLGLSFVPGANVASAGMGAAASVADLVSNIKEDGFDLGDVGRFALNIGLDLGTLIPGVGGVSKLAKLAKTLKESKSLAKAIKYINATSSAAGVANVVASWDNLQDGKWTFDDIRTIVNGVRGLTNMHRLHGSAMKKGSVSDDATITLGKNTDNPVTITKAQYEKIANMPKSEQKTEMAKIIIKQLPDTVSKKVEKDAVENVAGDKDFLERTDSKAIDQDVAKKSDESLLKMYGVDFGKDKSKFSWKNPSSWAFWNRGGLKSKFDFKANADTYRDPSNMNWWNWNRRAAIRDARTNRNNPYFKKMAELEGRKRGYIIPNEDLSMNQRVYAPADAYGDMMPTGRYRFEYLDGKITPVNSTNLWFIQDDQVKPQSNAFVYKNGGSIKKAENGFKWLSDIGEKINSGEQSVKPLIDLSRYIQNQKTTKEVWNHQLDASRALYDRKEQAYIPRSVSVSSYIAPVQQYKNNVRKHYADLKANIPVTNDATKNFNMMMSVAGDEKSAIDNIGQMESDATSRANIESTNVYNTTAKLQTDAANKNNAYGVAADMQYNTTLAERANALGTNINQIMTQLSSDAAKADIYRLNQNIFAENQRLQSANSAEKERIIDEAHAAYIQYAKNEDAAGRTPEDGNTWWNRQGLYKTALARLDAQTQSAMIENQTRMRNPFTGGLYSGIRPGYYYHNYNTYLPDETIIAGKKKGGTLSAQDRMTVDDNKSVKDINKEKVKNAIKALENNNKRLYELLYKLL